MLTLRALWEEKITRWRDRGHTKKGHATTRFLEGFSEGSLKEVLLGRVLRRHVVRISIGTEVLRRVLREGGMFDKAKAETRPFAEYDPLRMHPKGAKNFKGLNS